MQQEYYYTSLPQPIPITEQVWPEGTLPLVCTSTLAYNHEPYIRECLDGILMQKTTFPVQVLVHEDCSTDRTAEILKEYQAKYPNLIKVFYQPENVYSLKDQEEKRKRRAEFNSWRIGKYEALCEGDDYWIDPLKLQKQVDFLEANPEYGMVYTNANTYINNKNKFINKGMASNVSSFEDLLINGNRIPTLTTMFRFSFLNGYQDLVKDKSKNWKMGDYPLWLYISHNSKIYFMDEIMATYRTLENSASGRNDYYKSIDFTFSAFEVRKFFSSLLCKDIQYILEDDLNKSLFSKAFKFKKKQEAILYFNRIKAPNYRMKIKYLLCKLNLFWLF